MDNDAGVVPLNNNIFDPKMKNHVIDVYFFTASPPSRSVLLLIRALGIKHNIKIISVVAGENRSPEYSKINPLHTIPAINDNGFILYDSHVIMKYLSDTYAKDDSLCPKDPKRQALVNQRLYFDACYIFPKFFDYVVPVIFHGEQPNNEKLEKLQEVFRHLDKFLENETWVAGENLTIADFSIISIIATAEAIMIDISQYPNLWAWYNRCKNVMSAFGYEEINQAGADVFGSVFKSKIK